MPDKERAKSLAKLSRLRHNKISSFDIETETSLIVESYYEIIKELITALLFADGYKTLSHKDLINYLNENYNDFFNAEKIYILDDLRKRRNKIVYYGIFLSSDYLKRNEKTFDKIVDILFELIDGKIE